MSIIWWTLYILGAITIVIVWINLLTIFIKGCTVLLKKEWKQVKVIEGLPGPQGPMSRKDIEAFIRMEIASQLEKYEIFRNTYPGLMKDEFKLQKKEDK